MKGVLGGKIFWGPGLIIAKRVMDLCGPNQIFASDRIAKDLRALSEENKATMHPIGDYIIKHGDKLKIYNIYGKDFGNKTTPKRGKVIEEQESEFKKQPDFEFDSIELRLDITEPKTLMTHHTWIWNVKNISKNPLEQIFYSIGGDMGKDFADLNVKITDENDNELDIISLDVNKAHEKSFNVKIARPIRKNQRGRFVKLEYDWEEPSRVFEYVFSAKCKKFKYVFTAPKNFQIKNRILEVVRELGIKRRVENPPKINYNKDNTEIVWETLKNQKILPHDAFEFQW